MNSKFRNILISRYAITILGIMVILIVSLIFFSYYKEKYNEKLQGEFKSVFENYLKERYTDEMQIEQVYYNSKSDEYSCYAYPKKNSNLEFYAFVRKEKSNNKLVFRDNYLIAVWEEALQEEIRQYISNFYPEVFSVKFSILGKPVTKKDSVQYVFEFDDYVSRSRIPTYDEIKGNPYIKELYKKIEIEINGQINIEYTEKEYNSILKVIEFIRKKAYNVDTLSISYGTGSSSEDKKFFTAESKNIFIFNKKEIERINTVDDIRKKNKN